LSAYGNIILGWTEEGFQKAEEDSKNNKMVKTDQINKGKKQS